MNIIKLNYESGQGNKHEKYKTSTQKDIGEILSQPQTNNEVSNETNKNLILTPEEISIINEGIPNPQIRKIVIEIIDVLGKRICEGEKPSPKLLYEVGMNILYKNGLHGEGYAHPDLAKHLIRFKLPEWKGFGNLFEYESLYGDSAEELVKFRSERLKKLKSKSSDIIQPNSNTKVVRSDKSNNTTSNPAPIKVQPQTIFPKHISTDIQPEQEKVTKEKSTKQKIKAQYEAINDKDYVKHFRDFKRTDNIETDVPLLNPEDIAFSIYNGGYECITQYKHTKVPSFDIRQNGGVEEFIKKNGERNGVFSKLDGKGIIGRPYSFYNENDDISHIIIFCDNRGLNAGIHISIKGKVSQHDANDLIKYLKNKYSFEIDPYTGNINNMREINRGNIQETIMSFFNNK